MNIHDPELISAAREYLIGQVGFSGANTQLFLHILEEEEFADFARSLERGDEETENSDKVLTAYLQRAADLRKKAILLADLYGLSDEEERASFIIEAVSRRERFLPMEKTDAAQLQLYAEKVKAGMPIEQAIHELGLDAGMSQFETIRESTDWED